MRLALALAVTGCAALRGDRTDIFVATPTNRIALRDDALPGNAELLDDDRVAFAVDLDRACQRIPQLYVQHATAPASRGAIAGLALVGVAAALAAPCLAGCSSGYRSHVVIPGVAVGAGGLVVGLAALAQHAMHPRLAAVDSAPIDAPAPRQIGVPCGAHDVSGTELELVAPWGALFAAELERDGTARFDVDWLGGGVAPSIEGEWVARAAITPHH
jgi:hypothetical protein